MKSLENFKFELPVPFRLEAHRIHVVVIGLGGTGGYLFPNLARLITQLNNTGRKDILLTAIDGDIIEEKNINRQNFYFPDIGKNKADLMASRHGRLFGQSFGIVKKYVEDEQFLEDILFQDNRFPVVVSCVDNHRTRQMIWNVFKEEPEKFLWVDAGNEQFSGQVVVGFNSARKLKEDDREPSMFKLPCVAEVYPEILEAKSRFNSEISCDELAVDNIQNIAANIMSSTQLFITLNLLLGDNEEQGFLTNFLVEFDAKTGLSTTKPITYNNVSQYY